jgi:hypothetical protein
MKSLSDEDYTVGLEEGRWIVRRSDGVRCGSFSARWTARQWAKELRDKAAKRAASAGSALIVEGLAQKPGSDPGQEPPGSVGGTPSTTEVVGSFDDSAVSAGSRNDTA